jgi:hypothetical protein
VKPALLDVIVVNDVDPEAEFGVPGEVESRAVGFGRIGTFLERDKDIDPDIEAKEEDEL